MTGPERESAAHQRVAELVNHNEAIRQVNANPLEEDLQKTALGQVLHEIGRLIGAAGAHVYSLDDEGKVLRHEAAFSAGEVVVALAGHPYGYPGASLPLADFPGWSDLIARPDPQFLDVSDSALTRNAYEWHKAHGHQSVLLSALMEAGQPVGLLEVAFSDREELTQSQFEMCGTFAQTLKLLLHMSRPAEDAKRSADAPARAVENAVSQEREKTVQRRISELAKASAAFRRSAAAVSDSPDFSDALGQVFRELVTASSHASTAHLFSYDAQSNTLKTEFFVQDGELRCGSAETSASLLHAPVEADAITAFGACIGSGEICVKNLLQTDEAVKALVYPSVIDRHLQEGHKCTCAIPILSGDGPLGMIGLTCRVPVPISPEHRAQLSCLANQTSLVMQLIALAESRQAVALAEERRRMAQEVTAQIVKANEALSEFTPEPVATSKLNSYLAHVLAAIRELTGATLVNVYRSSEDASMLSLIVASTLGHHVDTFSAPECQMNHQPIALEKMNAAMRNNLRDAAGFGWVYADDPQLSPDVRDWLRLHKHESVAYLALQKDAGPLEMLALSFPDVHRREFPGMDVVMVVANQVGHALELRRVAEAERSGAIAAECARLAGEIHDTLAQGFAAIGFHLDAAERAGEAIPHEVQKHLDVIRELAQTNLTEARQSIRRLQPAELAQGGMEAALRRLVKSSQAQSTAKITLRMDENLPILPRRVEDQLLRIAQESITNSLKHAEAKRIEVSLASIAGRGVSLTVADNGKGFDVNSPSAGHGLLMVQERAVQIGATLTVVTEPGFGAKIIAAWAH